MSKITYHGTAAGEVKVYSGLLRVGTIRPASGGWRYFPKGTTARSRGLGEIMPTVRAVKNSLEAE